MASDRLQFLLKLAKDQHREMGRTIEALEAKALEEVDTARLAAGLGDLDAENKRLKERNKRLQSERRNAEGERDHLQELWDGAEETENQLADAKDELNRLRGYLEIIRNGIPNAIQAAFNALNGDPLPEPEPSRKPLQEGEPND